MSTNTPAYWLEGTSTGISMRATDKGRIDSLIAMAQGDRRDAMHMERLTRNGDYRRLLGRRVEIPVHYDLWMRGARMGTVTGFRHGTPGTSDYLLVRMDHAKVKKRVKLWRIDWEYAKFVGVSR